MCNRDTIKTAIAGIPEIIRWRYDIPNSFYIHSNASADELTAKIANKFPGRKCFLFVEISENRQGYLSKETWNFINQKL
jgi:hypothetical protein